MTPPSMYLAVMGEAFSRLSEPVRRFHSLAGSHVFHGMVEVRAPVSIVAKLLAIFIGAPLQSARGPIRFELNAAPHTEVWTRFFRPKTMRSTFARADSHITERLGASLLTFALSEVDGALEMQLKAMKFLGIVCPAWLMPHVTARETGENDRLNFQVEAVVPLIGRVASYVGYLDIPREGVK